MSSDAGAKKGGKTATKFDGLKSGPIEERGGGEEKRRGRSLVPTPNPGTGKRRRASIGSLEEGREPKKGQKKKGRLGKTAGKARNLRLSSDF